MFIHHVYAVAVLVAMYLAYRYGGYKVRAAVKAEAAKVEAAVVAEVRKL